ncbi:hypothetical protein ACOSP7_006717 [Xanthoceras sorbifolium]
MMCKVDPVTETQVRGRAKYGHNKDLCNEDLERGKKIVDVHEKAEENVSSKTNPYDPWLFVSYNKSSNRFGRKNNGYAGNGGTDGVTFNVCKFRSMTHRGWETPSEIDIAFIQAVKGGTFENMSGGGFTVRKQRKSARGTGGLQASFTGKANSNAFGKNGGSRCEVLANDDCEDADLVINNVNTKFTCETG